MTWLDIALAAWGTSGWVLFWWVGLRRLRTPEPEPEWGYVVLLKPEDGETKVRQVWCSKEMADRIRGDADMVRS